MKSGKHGFDEQLNLAAREVQFIWPVHPGAHTFLHQDAYSDVSERAEARII